MKTSGKKIFSGFTVVVLAACVAGAAGAQDLRDASPPAELPPEAFTSNQYVDSRGCVYIRAGINGNDTWVPRVTRTRQQLYGFQPSVTAGAAPAPAHLAPLPELEPEVTETAAAEPQPAQEPTPAPAPEPTPAPAPQIAS